MSMEPGPFLPHRIRLRGPWEFQWQSQERPGSANVPNGTIHLPATWNDAFGITTGALRLTRSFNRPTGIDDGERVWLELDPSRPSSVVFNGRSLGRVESGIARFDITERLAMHSRIELDIDGTVQADCDRPIVEAALVIEPVE